jgi:nitroreductase
MDFDEAVKARRSIRRFKPDALPQEYINALLEAARLAPSGLNTQPWRFAVVKDPATRTLLAGATPSRFIADAPIVIVCCVHLEAFASAGARMSELASVGAVDEASAAVYGSDEFIRNIPAPWAQSQLYMYSAIAITHLLLKAADLGLGSCWVGHFNEEKVKSITGIGRAYGVVALLPVGYADEQPAPRPRLPTEELLLKVPFRPARPSSPACPVFRTLRSRHERAQYHVQQTLPAMS